MNPVHQLKRMPWAALFQCAGATVALVTILDILLQQLYWRVPLVHRAIEILFTPPLGLILLIATYCGIGALAVYLLERKFQNVIINVANLWGLAFCLILLLIAKSFLPIPSFIVGSGQGYSWGIIVGVFMISRKYWRSYGGGWGRYR
jgi:hypothetical protein